MKNIIIVSFSIIAALIGAGFASGEEIICYFVAFGRYGILGLIFSLLLFALFIFYVLAFATTSEIKTYCEFMGIFQSNRTKKIIKGVTVIFSVSVYGAMLSALSLMISDNSPLSYASAGLICAVISTVIFTFGTDRVFAFNGIIGVGLVFCMVFAIMYILVWRETHTFSPVYIQSIADGAVYSGYNLITSVPLLVSLSRRLRTKTDCVAVTVTTMSVTALLMGLIFVLLSIYHNRINLGALPLLTLAKRQSVFFGAFYSLILSCAIITTLLSSGGSAIDSLGIKRKPLKIALLSAVSYLLSGIGFFNIINIAYRLSGICGIIVCGITLFCMRKGHNKAKNKPSKKYA